MGSRILDSSFLDANSKNLNKPGTCELTITVPVFILNHPNFSMRGKDALQSHHIRFIWHTG